MVTIEEWKARFARGLEALKQMPPYSGVKFAEDLGVSPKEVSRG